MTSRSLRIAASIALFLGCSADSENPTASAPDGGSPSDATTSGDAGEPPDSAGPGGDGGVADAAGGDAGDGAAPFDPCAHTFFCDDFDTYTAGQAPGGKWGKNESGGTIAVDTLHARSGKNAVKAAAAASGGYRSVMISLSDASLLPVTGNHLFGRMMFFLDGAPTGTVHWTFIDGSGPTPSGYDAIYRYGGQIPLADAGNFVGNQLMANYDTPDSYQTPPVGPSSDCWLHATTEVVPVGAWSCAEWEFDGPNNTMRFWLNGAPLTDLTMSGTGQGCVHQPQTFTWVAPQFKRIDLGWESYQADGARTLWIDDVALGTEGRLTCPPP
jgi:hypothetical protein